MLRLLRTLGTGDSIKETTTDIWIPRHACCKSLMSRTFWYSVALPKKVSLRFFPQAQGNSTLLPEWQVSLEGEQHGIKPQLCELVLAFGTSDTAHRNMNLVALPNSSLPKGSKQPKLENQGVRNLPVPRALLAQFHPTSRWRGGECRSSGSGP